MRYRNEIWVPSRYYYVVWIRSIGFSPKRTERSSAISFGFGLFAYNSVTSRDIKTKLVSKYMFSTLRNPMKPSEFQYLLPFPRYDVLTDILDFRHFNFYGLLLKLLLLITVCRLKPHLNTNLNSKYEADQVNGTIFFKFFKFHNDRVIASRISSRSLSNFRHKCKLNMAITY